MQSFADYRTGKVKLVDLTKTDLRALNKLKNYICFNDAPQYLRRWMLRHNNLVHLLRASVLHMDSLNLDEAPDLRGSPIGTLCYARPDIRIKVIIPPEVHKNLCT